MRAHSEILCIFQKAKQILKELYFAQELHFPPPSFPRIKYINKKKKKCCLLSKGSYNLLPPQRQKGDLWQLSQACIIITLLRGSERPETFSKWDTVKFIVPRQWHECTVHLPLIYQRMSTTPELHLYSLAKAEQANRSSLSMRAAFKWRENAEFDSQQCARVPKSCPSSEYFGLIPRKCWDIFLFNRTKLLRGEEMRFHL